MKWYLPCILGAALSLSLPMCQEYDGPPPLGSVKAIDPVADALMQKARQFMQDSRPGKAISPLKTIVTAHELSPNAAEARLMLGKAYEATQEYRDAFKQYTKLIERYQSSPLYIQALNRQLTLALNAASGKLKTPVLWGAWKTDMESSVVQEWLQTIIDHAPYNDMAATAASIYGKYLVDHQEPEKARAVYAKLVEDHPDSKYAPEAQLMVAQLWADSHTRGDHNLVNLTNAQEAYEEFSLRFPNHPDSRKALAEASNMKKLLVCQQLEVGRYYLERAKEYPSAIFCFEDVIRQKDVNPEAAVEAQQLLMQARQLQQGKAQH